jgi:cysteine desulfurase
MGASQELGHRAGTENVAGIFGFGKACQLAEQGMANYKTEVRKLRDMLQGRITSEIDDVIVNGSGQPRLANTLNTSFKNCASGAMVQELDEKGIAVSAHSACHSGDLDPSHVLRAMKIPETHIHGTLRISLSRFNTEQEVDEFLNILPRVVAKSRLGMAV